MTITTSGTITIQDLAVELGRSATGKTNIREAKYLMWGGEAQVGLADLYGRTLHCLTYSDLQLITEVRVRFVTLGGLVAQGGVRLIDPFGNEIIELPYGHEEGNYFYYKLSGLPGISAAVKCRVFAFDYHDGLNAGSQLEITLDGRKRVSAISYGSIRMDATGAKASQVPPVYSE